MPVYFRKKISPENSLSQMELLDILECIKSFSSAKAFKEGSKRSEALRIPFLKTKLKHCDAEPCPQLGL